MNDMCKIKILNGVQVQENGIIRNKDGYYLGRIEDIDFDSTHLIDKSEKMVDIEIDFDEGDLLYLAMEAHERDITLNQMINEMLTEFIKEKDNGTSND